MAQDKTRISRISDPAIAEEAGGTAEVWPRFQAPLLTQSEIEALLRPPVTAASALQTAQAGDPSQPHAGNTASLVQAHILARHLQNILSKATHQMVSVTFSDSTYAPVSDLVRRFQTMPILLLFHSPKGSPYAALSLEADLMARLIEAHIGGVAVFQTASQTHLFKPHDLPIMKTIGHYLASRLGPNISLDQIETDRSLNYQKLPSGKADLAEFHIQMGPQTRSARFCLLQAPRPNMPDALSASQTLSDPACADLADAHREILLTARLVRPFVETGKLIGLKKGSVLKLGLTGLPEIELVSGDQSGQGIAKGTLKRQGQRLVLHIDESRIEKDGLP